MGLFSWIGDTVADIFNGDDEDEGNIIQETIDSTLKSITNQGIQYGQNWLSNQIFPNQKIPGVPVSYTQDPQTGEVKQMSGTEAGQWFKDYMNQAYPNTTPWERLGSTGGNTSASSVGTSAMQAKKDLIMQQQQLQSNERIARMQTRSGVISAGAPLGTGAVSSLLDQLDGRASFFAKDYDTNVKQSREILDAKLDKELHLLDAETRSKIRDSILKEQQAILVNNQIAVEAERAKRADLIADAELTAEQTKTMQSAVTNIGHGFMDKIKKAYNSWRFKKGSTYLRDNIRNNGKKPVRFMNLNESGL